jgi:serine/threonine-protein kinase RsbW
LIQKKIIIKNDTSEIKRINLIVREYLKDLNPDHEILFQIELALEEIVVNIINYAFPENGTYEIEISISYDKPYFIIEVTDKGKAFNPLESEAPDFTAKLEERKIGGLGIHLVKSFMDKIIYKRINRENHLIMKKEIFD